MPNVVKKFIGFLFLQLTLLSIPLGLQAQVDPNIEWKEIETEGAYWIFDAKHQEVAEYYIMQFQRAKEEVLGLFKEPPRKPTILLIDNTDIANGSARVTPHPVIVLFTVQPSNYSSIGEFNDYVHELLVHEYTHILNMEPIHGWMSPVSWIFGSIAHPNMILPRWYTEGLAVYTESKISKTGGRLNSQYLEGLARSLTLEKKWDQYPLSDLNDTQLDWLGASRAYLFGGILWDSITRAKGEEMVYKFNQSYSRRVPFFLDGVIESYLEVNYQEQLKKAYDFWESQAQQQIDIISKSPNMPGEKVTNEADGMFLMPKISSDGLWMANIRNDLEGAGHIELTLRHPKLGFRGYKSKRVVARSKTRSVAWHPASTGFVYEKLSTWDFYNQFYDLYFYDLRTKQSKRLTRGQRAHNACFSALGKSLYYLRNNGPAKQLVAMDWLSQKTTLLYESKVGDDLRHLSCGDNQNLYFVEHLASQTPRLIKMDVASKIRSVAFSQFPVQFATHTHRGVLLASPQSGIDNLYLLDNQGKATAVTNTLTRVLQGEIDPLDDGLYFSQLTSDGPKIYYLKGAQWESLPDQPPKVPPIVDYTLGEEKKPSTNDTARTPSQATVKKHPSEDFSPWRYLYPNHWIPFLYVVDRGMIYQAMTSAGDPLGINTISLVGQWDTLTKKAGGSASYINQSLPVSLGLAVSDLYNFFYPTDSTLHFTNASALLGYRLGFLDDTQMLFRWNYSQLEFDPDIFIRQGPQLQFSYSDTEAKPQDISVSEGWRFQLGHRQYLTDFGNQDYGETYAHIGTFWSSFTPGRSVLYLGVNGSYTPQLLNRFFSPSTLAGPFFNPQITNTAYLQRGYPTGVFLSDNALVNANFEYRFPMIDIFSGWTSPPVFFNNLQGSLVFDATTLDGIYNNSSTRSFRPTEMGRWFTGYGLELESRLNVGFHVPVTLTLGLYYGQEQQARGGFTTFFNVRL